MENKLILIRGRYFGEEVNYTDLLRIFQDLTKEEFQKSGGKNYGIRENDKSEKLENGKGAGDKRKLKKK